MTEIRKVEGNEIKEFVGLMSNAYPLRVPRSADNLAAVGFQLLERMAYDASQSVQGLYRDGAMLGGMIVYDFMMTYRQGRLPIGGVGSVAVDLLHKKEQVCKEMISHFLGQARRKHQTVVALYPFRPDFYKKMGFGYGGKCSEYRIDPLAFPAHGVKARRNLSTADAEELALCYNRCAKQRHGMLARTAGAFRQLLANPDVRLVGHDDGDGLKGFLALQFKARADKHFLIYDMLIDEMVYEDTPTLLALLAFLRSQADQAQRVILYSQELHFHYLLRDPRDDSGNLMPVLAHPSHTTGVGIMYRLTDLQGFFRKVSGQSFGGQSCCLKIAVHDDFLPENNVAVTVRFQNGFPSLAPQEQADVELEIAVAELSSLLMGAVDFNSLRRYGLATLSDESYGDIVQKLFLTAEPPLCSTRF